MTTTIVVPCFNEADRFDEVPFLRLADQDHLALLFVDDGCTDGTGAILTALACHSESISVLELTSNSGKGEAVRRGLLAAIEDGATIVGYYDADAATPPDQLVRLIHALEADPRLIAVLGARVARLGSRIDRSVMRHYAGRLYATLASVALDMDVYDTQCGAKVFRVVPSLTEALATPFPSSWSFDTHLIYRLATGSATVPPEPEEAFLEVPLDAWRDVSGSKLRPMDAVRAVVDVTRLLARRTGEHRRR